VKKDTENRRFRMIFVLAGGVLMLTILVIAKLFPDSGIAPLLFIIGWAIFAIFLGKFLRDYKWRK
jgi:hypothetical protein